MEDTPKPAPPRIERHRALHGESLLRIFHPPEQAAPPRPRTLIERIRDFFLLW
jgi:hypothetical protein